MDIATGLPTAPRGLTPEAKAEWNRLIKILGPKCVLTPADRAAMTILCESWSKWVMLGKMINRVLGASGFSMDVRRMYSAQHEAYGAWQQMAARFGLTPADRPRVKQISDGQKDKEEEAKGRFRPRLAQ